MTTQVETIPAENELTEDELLDALFGDADETPEVETVPTIDPILDELAAELGR